MRAARDAQYQMTEDYLKHHYIQSQINMIIQRGFFTRNIPETENDDWWVVSFDDDSNSLRFYGDFSGRNCDKCGNYMSSICDGITQIQCNCFNDEEVLFKAVGRGYCPYTKSRECGCDIAYQKREKDIYEMHDYLVLIQTWWRKAIKGKRGY